MRILVRRAYTVVHVAFHEVDEFVKLNQGITRIADVILSGRSTPDHTKLQDWEERHGAGDELHVDRHSTKDIWLLCS